jgi:hypothetical protein
MTVIRGFKSMMFGGSFAFIWPSVSTEETSGDPNSSGTTASAPSLEAVLEPLPDPTDVATTLFGALGSR